MSFLFSKNEFDEQVEKATSEYLPNGIEDIALNFEICDQIRGKAVPAKDAMRALKKRIQHKNPNVQMLALKLTDACVKNGGHHFLVEVASSEFMDALVSVLRSGVLSYQVKVMILQYIQSWGMAFKSKPDLSYVYQKYTELKNEGGWQFPPLSAEDKLQGKAIMIETAIAPEWTDSAVCERCRTQFTFTLRKHHCRACGKTFCQSCSSKNISLPHFGVTQEVRVCDGCYARKGYPPHMSNAALGIEAVAPSPRNASSSDIVAHDPVAAKKELDDLERAIALSLEEASKASGNRSSVTKNVKPSSVKEPAPEEEDPELAAAIAASLAEMKVQNNRTSSFSQKPSAPSSSQPSNGSQSENLAPRKSLINPNDISETELENMELFVQLIERLDREAAINPGIMLEHSSVKNLYEQMLKLHPKLLSSLHDAITKHRQFLELHNKVTDAVKNYEGALQQRLNAMRSNGPTASPYGYNLPNAQGYAGYQAAPQPSNLPYQQYAVPSPQYDYSYSQPPNAAYPAVPAVNQQSPQLHAQAAPASKPYQPATPQVNGSPSGNYILTSAPNTASPVSVPNQQYQTYQPPAQPSQDQTQQVAHQQQYYQNPPHQYAPQQPPATTASGYGAPPAQQGQTQQQYQAPPTTTQPPQQEVGNLIEF
ncbi:hypothetical protein BKA69DRAFT_1050319 [Paraphysoderma sedebokerense]|nr:hypothetical protein BKA69DRAFT_1050319 [Paraphysoderma sedebokerense]